MPSPSAAKFLVAVDRATVLYRAAGDSRLRPQATTDKEALCHAALTALVAAWNAYVGNVIADYFAATANPTDARFNLAHTLAKSHADKLVEKFNTPNWENSRNLIAHCTGYDPINDWVWASGGLTGFEVRTRLKEILKLRHSFAHGFQIPTYGWIQFSGGRVVLTKAAVGKTTNFIRYLVLQTDRGLAFHVRNVFSLVAW